MTQNEMIWSLDLCWIEGVVSGEHFHGQNHDILPMLDII